MILSAHMLDASSQEWIAFFMFFASEIGKQIARSVNERLLKYCAQLYVAILLGSWFGLPEGKLRAVCSMTDIVKCNYINRTSSAQSNRWITCHDLIFWVAGCTYAMMWQVKASNAWNTINFNCLIDVNCLETEIHSQIYRNQIKPQKTLHGTYYLVTLMKPISLVMVCHMQSVLS